MHIRDTRLPASREEVELANRLRYEGKTIAEIARRVRRSRKWVYERTRGALIHAEKCPRCDLIYLKEQGLTWCSGCGHEPNESKRVEIAE